MADYNGQVGTYSHSDYTGLREHWLNMVNISATSNTAFAHFASRNKILVRAVHVWTRSSGSGAGSLEVYRGGSIAAKLTTPSMQAGHYYCVTLTADNTAETITTVFSLRRTTGDKGDVDVLYEYQVLYPTPAMIGS